MNSFDLHEAIFHVWRLVDYANKMMEEEKPWTLVKDDPEKGSAILSNLLEVLRHISILISPFIPETTQKIRKQLGLPAEIDRKKEDGWGVMKDWKGLGESEIIFPRIEE
jgi:methionyl-tRNA synthetase